MLIDERSTFAGETAWEIYKTHGLWATSFYAYVPGLVGLVLVDQHGAPKARCFAYGGKKLLGPIYDDDKTGQRFLNLLMEDGYTPRTDQMLRMPDTEVPALRMAGSRYCPLPHWDNVEKPFWINYNQEKDTFKYSSTPKGHPGELRVKATYSYDMWLTTGIVGA